MNCSADVVGISKTPDADSHSRRVTNNNQQKSPMNHRFERGDSFIIFLGIVLFVLDKSKKTLKKFSSLNTPILEVFRTGVINMTPTQTRHYFLGGNPSHLPLHLLLVWSSPTWEDHSMTPLLPLSFPKQWPFNLGPDCLGMALSPGKVW